MSLYIQLATASIILGIIGFIIFICIKASGKPKSLSWLGKGLIAIAILLLNISVLCIPYQSENFTTTSKHNELVEANKVPSTGNEFDRVY
ncbi:MAG: hypothetical protein CBD97_02150 [Pelagibacteraceae bacterium TMED237]|nr:MAG: hypothetical protein CBD97_02150 [Pelagibacteraceae bacterium TMED237]|tara:strand:+ start:2492 stop:2761 length:270 start_codon:yes stop_codon:yes gene_type:complete